MWRSLQHQTRRGSNQDHEETLAAQRVVTAGPPMTSEEEGFGAGGELL